MHAFCHPNLYLPHPSILTAIFLPYMVLYVYLLLQVPFIGWTGNMPLAGNALQRLLQSAAKPFVSTFMKRTGQQFFMRDTDNGQRPLLVRVRLAPACCLCCLLGAAFILIGLHGLPATICIVTVKLKHSPGQQKGCMHMYGTAHLVIWKIASNAQNAVTQ